jgi:hypothetical protein
MERSGSGLSFRKGRREKGEELDAYSTDGIHIDAGWRSEQPQGK